MFAPLISIFMKLDITAGGIQWGVECLQLKSSSSKQFPSVLCVLSVSYVVCAVVSLQSNCKTITGPENSLLTAAQN